MRVCLQERLPERQLEWLVQRRVCSESHATKVPWYQAILNLFSQPVGYKPLLVLTAIFVAQNFSGVYITLFYAAPFFKVRVHCNGLSTAVAVPGGAWAGGTLCATH